MVVRAGNRIAARRGAAIGAGHTRGGRGVNHGRRPVVSGLDRLALAIAGLAVVTAALPTRPGEVVVLALAVVVLLMAPAAVERRP